MLWVTDDTDDKVYVYDLPGAQPDNTVADGAPGVRTPSEQVLTATLTVATSPSRLGYTTVFVGLTFGTLSPSATFNVGTVTYTIHELQIENNGHLTFYTSERIPQRFSFIDSRNVILLYRRH